MISAMKHSIDTWSFSPLAGTLRTLETFPPTTISFLTKPLAMLSSAVSCFPFNSQFRSRPLPAQVKFAASQAQAVVLTGLVITTHDREHQQYKQ